MKKLLFAVAFILVANFSFAQSDAFKADVKKLLEVSGSMAQVDVAKKQVIAMIPADKQAEFTKEFEASITPIMDAQEAFYLKEFTQDDVKQMIKFYQSPAGKKLAAKLPELTESTMPAIQAWTMELQGIIMKYQQ
ncbi:MAG: hypothetical protein BM557_00490 [Flavobacterium sp. MedPE-SWcel]|uniref:DUF2059 domain-containing protein n=1 Tax=uncultured Flavobacterium sp. TaxID=165435 RepID=UPI0009185994|nr:DUF2059 domain-containing protein [uncultured Flavobacterium sp.]OIQ22499.1 MAG: hypothetical protein BM557_00490 [Flavobacterium sp. MedPE-SWcel]